MESHEDGDASSSPAVLVEDQQQDTVRADSPVLRVSFLPAAAGPGDPVRVAVEITNPGTTPLEKVLLVDDLEDGFTFIKPFSINTVFDREAGQVLAEIPSIQPGQTVDIQYLLRVEEDRARESGELRVHHVVLQDSNGQELVSGQASLWVGPVEKEWRSVQAAVPGSWISLGPVNLRFHEQETRQNVAAVLSDAPPIEGGPEFQFEVSMYRSEGISADSEGKPNEQRAQFTPSEEVRTDLPVQMEVDFTQIESIQDLPPGRSPFVATFDEVAEVWVKVPNRMPWAGC